MGMLLLLYEYVSYVVNSILKGSINISRITLQLGVIEMELTALLVGDPILVINKDQW